MKKFLCIHGHFYQPPRENAWLEIIEQQDSAFPFHDWNERITHECYGPNATSRILDENGKITNIVNNYSRISFNFGPTLLSWLETHSSDVYRSILEADKLSLENFNGHGSALAQVYNHIIMPLATKRDKETQVKWGIYDFESRFKRFPEGMWLAETAVDTETLEVLAENNIKFTILAPGQCRAVRKKGDSKWSDTPHNSVDPKKPYLINLPSGKSITVFFYDGNVSQAVAFKGLLKDGKYFAQALIEGFTSETEPQLMHIATDGESYGHHHRHGDMALAFCLDHIEKYNLAELINYGAYLEKFPPEYEAMIVENSSWSCFHGVERWRNNCGCNSGMSGDWHQQWRKPLREALNWLSEEMETIFVDQTRQLTSDPWELRNKYIKIIRDRSEQNVERFLIDHIGRTLKRPEKTKLLRMLEMQRNGLLMYTSCGWFFDEVSGIETTQILQYADRAIQLAESESHINLSTKFHELLTKVPSNIKDLENAAIVHEKYIKPSRLTLSKVGMHYAVASIFDEVPESIIICNYRTENEYYERLEAGIYKLVIGKTKVHSNITWSLKTFHFAAVYLGQNHIIGNFAGQMEDEKFHLMVEEISEAFSESRLADVIGIMQSYFGPEKFSLWNLFKDEQRKVLYKILEKDIQLAEDSYKKIYNRNYNIMNVLRDAVLPIPEIMIQNLEIVLNNDIRNFFESKNLYPSKLEKLAKEARSWRINIDKESIGIAASEKLLQLFMEQKLKHYDIKLLNNINRIFRIINDLELSLDLWQFQNEYFRLGTKLIKTKDKLFDPQNDGQMKWLDEFKQLGDHLNVRLAY